MATKQKSKKKTTAGIQRELATWKSRGTILAKAKSGNQWEIADWMRNGVDRFKRKVAYAEAADITGMKVETLRTFFSVANKFPASTRVDGLSFGHHRLVVRFEEEVRKTALAWAEKRDMSIHEFAEYIRKEEKKLERRKHAAAAKDNPNYYGDLAAEAVIKRISPMLAPEKSFYTDDEERPFLEMEMTPAKRDDLLEKIREAEACLGRWAKALESKSFDKAMPAKASGD